MIAAIAPALASANVFSDINMPTLTESPTRVGSYHMSSSTDRNISFRWVSDPNHTTVLGYGIAGGGLPSQTVAIDAHNTNRFILPPANGPTAGAPFDLWARVAIGAGSMSARTGNLGR